FNFPSPIVTLWRMAEATRILKAIDAGDSHAAAQLLPLVYDELRKLAAGHMANERLGHSLDATALVHEAYLRLVGDQQFGTRRPFFAAAAEPMGRIPVDPARQRQARKRGGSTGTARLDPESLAAPTHDTDFWMDLDEALALFAEVDADAAELAKLRIFGGLS